ncbi:hypothetical protein GCM10010495_76730 [Kitasatospora herbaricolor]|uniref:tetratricopeptide repeat protein n=1 Tax=Kitasatospora herbaricolor TaxID=68217 RepID=UPI00174E8446|nr:tetratricopeptide repeat protein [Kitasatospora herbaricolor]MDQ0305512.1 tetratricopeptide (TPR) repeat protein [Kitasatospora herbaricolor]GGV47681.1 hypothetical protein GCM10010495_76730 [Kitasatospora herbaricolor]
MTTHYDTRAEALTLQDMPRPVLELAITLSTATRIEPSLLRTMRLAVRPALDVGVESDLWFGPWVMRAGGEYMAFRPTLLAPLREKLVQELEMAAPTDPLLRCGEIISTAHRKIAPILDLEEKATWVAVRADAGRPVPDTTIDDLLAPALLAAQEHPERRPGLFRWLSGAWKRLPGAVRASFTLTSLITLLEDADLPSGASASGPQTRPWAQGPPTYVLPVRHDGAHITLGDPTWPATGIRIPDTQPLQVQVADTNSWNDDNEFISLRKGSILTVPVSHVPVYLRTSHGTVYRLGDASTGQESSTERAPDVLLGTAIAQLTDRDAMAHGVKPVPVSTSAPARLPTYVRRAVDAKLTAVLDPAQATNRLVIAEGEPGSGRTRALWEALRRSLPAWWLWSPPGSAGQGSLAAALENRPLGTPLVIWLDDLDTYLDAFDGELTAGALRRLLADTQRGPVLIAGTRNPAGPALREATARELLQAATTVTVPPAFSANELRRAFPQIETDPHLQHLLGAVILPKSEQIMLRGPHGRMTPRSAESTQTDGIWPGPYPMSALPPQPSVFTGHAPELDLVLEALTGPPADRQQQSSVVGIVGMPGIGKSTLALEAATWLRRLGYFPGGIIYARAGRRETDDTLTRCLVALGVASDSVPDEFAIDRAEIYRSLLAERTRQSGPVLVIVDDVIDPDSMTVLRPPDPASALLYTTRQRSPRIFQGRQIELGVLQPEQAVALLEDHLTRLWPHDNRVSDEPEAAREIAALCGYLPLALTIIADTLMRDRAISLSALAQELRHLGLTALDSSRSLRAAFDVSYERLTTAQARTLQEIAANPGPDLGTDAALFLLSPKYTHQHALAHLRALASAGLMNASAGRSGERWSIHPLVRQYAQQASKDDSEQRSSLLRLLEHYVHLLKQADALLRTQKPVHDSDQAENISWLETERANLLALAQEAHQQHLHQAVIDIATGLAEYLTTTRRFDELEQLAGLAVRAAESTGDRAALSGALNNLAIALYGTGRTEEALELFRRAASSHENTSRHHAQVVNNIGASLLNARRFDDALAAFDQAAAYYNDAPTSRALGQILGNRAHTLLQLHRYDEAIATYRDAAGIAGADESRRGELALVLTGLGSAYLESDRSSEAIETLHQAANVYQRLNDQQGLALALYSLGNAYRYAGRHSEAIVALETALDALPDPSDIQTRGGVLTSLASAFMEAERFEDATRYLDQAMEVHTRLDDPQQMANTLNNLGLARFEIGGTSDAVRYLQRAQELHQRSGNVAGQAEVLFNIGNLNTRSQQYEEALSALESALSLFRRTQDARGQAQTLNTLGIALLESGRVADAVPSLEESANLYTTLGDHQAAAQSLNNLGNTFSSLGNNQRAIQVLQQAVQMLTETADSHKRAQTLTNLAITQLRGGRTGQALATLIRAERLFVELGDEQNTRRIRAYRNAAVHRSR